MANVLLPRNLEGLAKVAADNPTRFALSGIRLKIDGGEYTAEAADGKVLVRVVGTAPDAAEHLIPLEPNAADRDEALIPAREWAAAFKQVPKRGKPELQTL